MGHKETQPKVSVVVSCYNYGGYLAASVQSALGQTYPNLEVIIVDDGSTDDTPHIAKWLTSDPRVQYVRQENRGQASAKNAGIRRSTGEFVAFLDADDRWAAAKIAKQIPLFEDTDVGVVFSLKDAIGPDGGPVSRDYASRRLEPHRGRVSEPLFVDNFIPFSSAVVRRSVFDKVGMMDESLTMGIDWDLWLRASVHFLFDYVDEALLEYREGHANQMSRNQEERNLCAEKIMTRFQTDNPKALSPRCVRRAWSYTFNNRGFHFRLTDVRRSTACYLRSVSIRPLQYHAYRGLVQNAVIAISRALGLSPAPREAAR